MLPQPSDGFEWVQAAPGPALACRALTPLAPHLFTTRRWQLGSASANGDGWAEVAAAIGIASGGLVRARQVHGAAVLVADADSEREIAERSKPLAPADIIVSRRGDRALAVQTADCVPVLMADRAGIAVAAVHAGWRGLAAGAPREAVRALEERFGIRPRDLMAAIGPAIGACCYQVGRDVRDAFAAAAFTPEQLGSWFAETPLRLAGNPTMPSVSIEAQTDRWFFDGWAAAREQLEAAGIPDDQIHVAALCTASHADVFCSYRRDGAPAGRLAAVIK